jgi:O-acetyl-ADP-ribose deacetylase (regulator of RNase III)
VKTLKGKQIGRCTIAVVRGDITECNVDAIVNAANSYLKHGGGVAGAIVRKGGAVIQEESDTIGFVPVGGSALTSGGALKAPFVIHAVGPRWGEGGEEAKLRQAVVSTLALASDRLFTTIAMPAISGGIFGFPKERCAAVIVEETARFVAEEETSLRKIYFCLMDEDMIGHFVGSLETIS